MSIMSISRQFCSLGVLACVFVICWFNPVLAQKKHIAEEIGIHSIDGNSSTAVEFVNNSKQTVKIYWLDYGGKRKLYKYLAVGESYIQQTYLTHPWLTTDIQDNALQLIFPDSHIKTVEIK
jgi:von Hippel-Lindau disease tumor supressor